MEKVIQESACPKCKTKLPVHVEYVTWCHVCGWNLNPAQPPPLDNAFVRLYEQIGLVQNEALFKSLKQNGRLTPRLSLAQIVAFSLAALVHLSTLLVLLVGIFVLVRGWPNIFAIGGGALCLLIFWHMLPRLAKPETDFLARKEFPTLYDLAEEVAQAVNAPSPDVIQLDSGFTAQIAEYGWKRQRVLTIGLPLWHILDDDERLALVAHELAHLVNGDPLRGIFVGTAVSSLAKWYTGLHPRALWRPQHGALAILEWPANLLLLIAAQLPLLTARLLVYLLLRNSLRAEFYADRLAASVAGTAATLRMLEKLYFFGAYQTVVHQVGAVRRSNRDFFAELNQRIQDTPPRELERIRRIQRLESSRLDATHPPTPLRIEMLESHRIEQAAVQISPEIFARIEQEYAPVQAEMRRFFNKENLAIEQVLGRSKKVTVETDG